MDIFTTAVLNRVVSELPAPAPFILNSFFRNIQTETSEEIHFDVDSSRRRLAPFVAPIVAGKVVLDKGYTTKTFTPAYIKDKRVFDANRPFKRAMGERIGGNLDPMQRLQLALTNNLIDQTAMLTRRQEVMAVEALRTGVHGVHARQARRRGEHVHRSPQDFIDGISPIHGHEASSFFQEPKANCGGRSA
jgi:hypothetical protein